MGRYYFHSTETVWEMIAQEEWLGCSHDASSMLDIPGSTPVWAQCILFFWFLKYKNLCICILISKSICSIKEHWWSLTSSWPDEVQKLFSTAHEFYIRVLLKNHRLLTISWVLFKLLYFILLLILLSCFI